MSGTEACSIRLRNALQLQLPTRFCEIQSIIDEYSSKELHMMFPLLVEDIFGITNQIGWGLRRTVRNYHDQEFFILFDFLKPHGVFFKLCYKLISDIYFRYDFPLNYLPRKVRDMIEDGMIPAFYMDKLKVDQQTRVPTALSLNSFEYYMFHFAYHLVNPWIQKEEVSRDLWDTVYLQIAEEYVRTFLPCDGSLVQPLAGYFMTKASLPLQTSSRPAKLPTLFRQSLLLTQSGTSSSFHSSPTSTQQSTHVEVWRSEVISQVFIDFWLSFDEKDVSPLGSLSSPERLFYSPSSFSTPKQSITDTVQDSQRMQHVSMFHYPRLPSMEHMRVVRNLLKHIHYFANSFCGDGTAMDELKRIILPTSQAKIYAFLRRTVDQWPLDSSFRLVLETWLSYIQPWRYTSYRIQTPMGQPREGEAQGNIIDRKWLGFIAENLLAYTVILQQVLRRFSRLDLVTPKNAVMLFRTSKVFSQPGLSNLLTEVESCLDDSASTSILPQKWSAIVRQQVLELEGPSFMYTFLFGTHSKTDIMPFCQFVYQAYSTAYALQKTEEYERTTYPTSFLTTLWSMFSNSYPQSGDYSLEDRTKVTSYLELALQQLCTVFRIGTEHFQIPPPGTMLGETPAPPSVLNDSVNTDLETTTFHQLQLESNAITPRAAKLRARHIQYEGDPDTQPVKSTENAFLVRLLYQVSSKLNEMYSEDMTLMYHRNDFYGRMARQVLTPPTVTRNFDKRFPGRHSPRVEVYLPPRLSLRVLASHQILVYYMVSCAIAYMCGYGPLPFTVILFGVWAAFIVVKAFFMTWFERPANTTIRQASHSYDEALLDTSFIS